MKLSGSYYNDIIVIYIREVQTEIFTFGINTIHIVSHCLYGKCGLKSGA